MPKIIDTIDARGGYATDLPPELMEPNMVLKAENLYWKDDLVSRGGKSAYSTLSTYATVVRGEFRGYLNSLWMNVGAFDNGSYVELWKSTGTTWSAISTAVHFQTGYDVKMDQLGSYIVVVNGYDRPHTLYYSTAGAYVLTSLDRHDERVTSTFDWWAGVRYTTGTTEYVDLSTAAYSTVASDFTLTPTTLTSDGHYIVSDYPFTKAVYTSASNISSSAVVAYHYWTSTGWKVFTSIIEADPVWTTLAGRSTAIDDRTLEFPYFSDWIKVNTTSMGVNLENRYAVRVTFPTAPSTVATAQKIAVSDIHYLTRIMGDDRPGKVVVHNNKVFMIAGNNAQISPYNSVQGWDEFSVEYFQDGGSQVEAVKSYADYLLVVKSGALYGFFGNSYQDWTKRKLSNMGSNWGDSVAVVGEVVVFLSRDGVRMWNGTENVLVSKHIGTDIDSWTKTGANAIAYKGFYILSFPSTSVLLVADPDTFRRDDLGDGRISFFKWNSMRIDAMQWNTGANDDGFLLGVVNSTAPSLVKMDNGNGYDETTVGFLKDLKTRYNSQSSPGTIKRAIRLKPEIAGPGSWTLLLSADNGDTVTTDVSVALGITSTFSATAHYTTDVSIPYQMDGRNLAFELQTQSTNPVKIFGFSVDVETRRY